MAGCGATGEQHIVYCTGQRIFYSASFSVEQLNEIRETEFESRRFLNVRYKNLWTNQNREITWVSQGCSNTTLGTRLGASLKDDQFSFLVSLSFSTFFLFILKST